MALIRCGGDTMQSLDAFYYASVSYTNDCIVEYFPKSTNYTLDRASAQGSASKGGLTVSRNANTGAATIVTTFDCVGYIDGVETQFTANTPITRPASESTYRVAIPLLN